MVSLKAAFAKYGVLLSLCHSFTSALPLDTHAAFSPAYELQSRAEDFYLRIMPLGASITNGKPTPEGTNGDSYRRALRDKLRFEGWKVNMVGSQPNGAMNDNDNEGYPGKRVEEITKLSRAAQEQYHPNLILINAGTNDAVQGFNVATTGERMEALINECFSLTPETVVILSTLIPCQANDKAPGNVDDINEQYRNLAARLQKQGYHIMLAEMHDGFLTIDDIDPKDHTHPFESGDRKMAAVWSYAFDQVVKKKWLKAPRHMDEFSDDDKGGTTCPKTYGSGRIDTSDKRQGMEVLTAGSHRIMDDGKYVHDSDYFGTLRADGADLHAKLESNGGHRWHLAQLYNAGAPRGQELDDLVTITGKDATSMVVYINQGKGKFDDKIKIDVHDSCLDRGIRWGDVDGDGLDDFICIGRDGDIAASRNMGGNPPTFKYLGGIKTKVDGYGQDRVRLGDIDGDGRLDYCVCHDNGDIRCWRNGGLGEKPAYWQDMGIIFYGKDMGDLDGVRFVDINGDGKDDWLWVDSKDGSITTWINQRGYSKSMRPYWKKAGKTHAGMGSIKDGPNQILLGRVFGSGRADYVYQKEAKNQGELHNNLIAWKNTGKGGVHLKGDGAYWGDLTGTGRDDYLWINSEGSIVFFRNKNGKSKGPRDFDYEQGWDDMGTVLKTGVDRKTLHIGDWNGDGKDDIISAAEDSGALTVWITSYQNGQVSFDKKEIGGSNCKEGWGIGQFDIGARFADITGSGHVDYLCMAPDGKTTACLNEHGTSDLRCVDQVKFSEDLDRANFHFTDVDGDGKADLLWTDKFNGNGRVWYNKGEVDERLSGSKFRWEPQKALAYQGASRGPNMHFPNLGGIGRSDMVYVEPQTGHGWAWFSTCHGGGDDVDGPVPDPKLPEYKPSDDGPKPDPGDDSKMCPKQLDFWTSTVWKDNKMDQWIEDTSIFYTQNGWPHRDDIAQDPDAVRSFAYFHLLEEDDMWGWDSQCRDITGSCDPPSGLIDQDKCPDNWQRAMTIYSASNLARFLQNFRENFQNVIDNSIKGRIGDMVGDFIPDQAVQNAALASTSWITMSLGILGMAAPVIGIWSSVGSAVAGGVSSAMVVGGAMVPGSANQEHDPKFTTWAELSGDYTQLGDTVKDTANDYFKKLFAELPAKGDTTRGLELSNVLKSGVWMNQDLGTGSTDIDDPMQRRIGMAPVISEMWNSQRVFVHKFKKDWFKLKEDYNFKQRTFLWDPCTQQHEGGGNNMKKYDEQSVCDGDYNYVLWSWDSDEGYFFNDYGTNDDTLDNYESLTLKDMVMAAERIQNKAGKFIPREEKIQTDIFSDLAHDPESTLKDGLKTQDAIIVNIPICDTSDIDIKGDDYDQSVINNCFDDLAHPAQDYRERCVRHIVMEACSKFKLGENKWPWSTDKHGFGKDD